MAPQRGDGPAPPLPPPAPVHPGELAPRSEDAPPALSSAISAVAPPPPPPPPLAQIAAGVSVAPTSLPAAPAAFITAPGVAAHSPAAAAAAAAAAGSPERPATPVPEIQTARTKAAKAAIENAVSALDLHLPAAAGKEILLLDIERLATGITDLEDAIAATRAAIVTAQSVANMPKARNLVQRLYDVNRAIAAQVHAQHPMEPVAAAAAAARILDPLQLPSVREAVGDMLHSVPCDGAVCGACPGTARAQCGGAVGVPTQDGARGICVSGDGAAAAAAEAVCCRCVLVSTRV